MGGQPPRQGHRGGARWRQAGSTPQKRQCTAEGATPRHKAINKAYSAHRAGGNVGTADRVKAPHSGVKMANRAYSRKAPGIHREQKKTPHSLRHAGHGYFWSFARSSSSNTGCNKIYNRITGGTSLHGNCSTYAGPGQAKVNRRAVVVLV